MKEKNDKDIVIYQSLNGKISFDVSVKGKTIWLSLNQIANLFERDKSVISRHLKEIYKSGELDEKSTVAFFATVQQEGNRDIQRNIAYYNLDVIISVGYRVNSKIGTHFRIWATNTLKQHLINGYTINEKRLKEYKSKIDELRKIIELFEKAIEAKPLNIDEATGLLKVITDYTYAFTILDNYDHEKLDIEETTENEIFKITLKHAYKAIEHLKTVFNDSNLVGKEKDKSFESSIKSIYQTYSGKELYPTIEEKAAHLLYFIVKNHSFIDGNKRIAAFIFIWYLDKNKILYKADGAKRIGDNALAALTLLIAESKSQEKDLIIKVIVNLINKKN